MRRQTGPQHDPGAAKNKRRGGQARQSELLGRLNRRYPQKERIAVCNACTLG
jgi:hypothetical protein